MLEKRTWHAVKAHRDEDFGVARSPLRWAGSKRSLLPLIGEMLPANIGRYIEPFMGSACVFFRFPPERAVLSDFNGELVQFFQTLRDHPSALHEAISGWSPEGDDYYAVRALEPVELPRFQRAARFLYLNRFSFNGVYRTNRQGKFNVPKGSRTGLLPQKNELMRASEKLQIAQIEQCDYRQATAVAEAGDFVYLDPPYRNADRPTLGEYGYGAFGSATDVEQLAAELARLTKVRAKVMLSFNDDLGLEDVLDGWLIERVSRRRNVAAATRHRTELRGEILATNFGRGGAVD